MPPSRRETDLIDTGEIAREQDYVSRLYHKLDAERETAQRRLTSTLRQTGGTPQARTERDISTAMYTERLAQLGSVEQGLCFGRLDFDRVDSDGMDSELRGDDETAYIGRLGLFDEDDEYRPLLLDWRAPVARPFYLATAASPEGVRRRRHIRSLSRKVVGLDDEILDLRAVNQGQNLGLAGEAALLAALERQRTGEMSDIVATIQAEQDRIIRSGLNGALVVQGGPGTGKTAVALHRAAYLLYTFRHQLATRGVLVVGPNSTFLRYIGQVLPSLGETGVLLATVGRLYPGLIADGVETRAAAEVKGRASMADLLAAAVRDRQQIPERVLEIEAERETFRLDRKTCAEARVRARRSRRPHNEARCIFLAELTQALTRQIARRLGEDLLDPRDLDDIRAELTADANVAEALASLWPILTPERLLDDLFAEREQLDSAAGNRLTEAERASLGRPLNSPWTPADVPLLDELAELLGEDGNEAGAEEARREREERAYAEGVLDILEQDEEIIDEELLRVSDVLDAELFAERQHKRSELTAAQRAAQDRTWTFGHVIVDEAQELSAMDWRLLMRRCPSRSMTLVGDVAQTGAPGGATSWDAVLSPYVADRWRLEELTVNYRTPAEIMRVAADVLAEVNPELEAPVSVRGTGSAPWRVRLEPGEVTGRIQSLVDGELDAVAGGTVAVLCPMNRIDEIDAALDGDDPTVSLMTVDRAKGLEFDAVVLVSPDEIVAESPRGLNDLYVALTRATRRLGVVQTGDDLPVLGGVGWAPASHATPNRVASRHR